MRFSCDHLKIIVCEHSFGKGRDLAFAKSCRHFFSISSRQVLDFPMHEHLLGEEGDRTSLEFENHPCVFKKDTNFPRVLRHAPFLTARGRVINAMQAMGKYFEGGAPRRAAASKKERSTARNTFASKAAQKPAEKPFELPALIGLTP